MIPRITVITLGVDDLERAVRFYRDGLGWSTDGIVGREFEHGAVAFFDLQSGLRLALWPRASIAHDTGIAATAPAPTAFTLGHNVSSRDEVDAVFRQATAAGAFAVKPPHETFWGGYAGYFQDPDGHLWELVWNPQWEAQSGTEGHGNMQQPDDILIEDCTAVGRPGWLEMRQALWPDCSRAQHLEEMRMWVADRGRYRQFLAYTRQSEPIGFIEASLRHDYVNGTLTSPVVFVEGLYVAPAFRRRGVARALMHAVRQWALALGCQELASDTDPGNTVSQATHRALGFEETERAVFFRMPLVRMPPDRG